MTNIIKSASKIVFVALALALIALTATGIVQPTDFIQLTGMAFVYYFTKPTTPAQQ